MLARSKILKHVHLGAEGADALRKVLKLVASVESVSRRHVFCPRGRQGLVELATNFIL